jgi:uroporphyrinogen-III decarboxylase
MRLGYLRGFESFMLDVAEDRPELHALLATVTGYWSEVVQRWLDLEVEVIQFADDLGHQSSLPMHPDRWRALILPAYQKLFAPCRARGVEVQLHTDGYIVDILPDLIEAGVTALNPQDLVNGLDNLKRLAWNKTCIVLDVDRQKITAFGTPDEIEQHVANCVRTLGSPQGGLMMVYGAYPGTPVENVGAVIRAMQKHHAYWLKRD